MTRWESCPSSIIADADNYYTKHQVDELIEGASGCCITPEEVDEKIEQAVSGKQDTLIAGSGITISGNVISADGADLSNYYTKSETSGKTEIANALNSLDNKKLDASAYTPTDLSNYYTKSETSGKTELSTAFNNKQDKLIAGANITISGNVISAAGGSEPIDAYTKAESDARFQPKGEYATEAWVEGKGYVTNATVLQYITNLQNQIDNLSARLEECCSQTGETLYRWVTMTGASDYVCSGTTKMSKEAEEQSADGGVTWTRTGNYRTGSTVLEIHSSDCGYSGCSPFTAVTSGGTVLIAPSNSEQRDGHLSWNTTNQGIIATSSTTITSVTISDCVFEIDNEAFAPKASDVNYVNVVSFDIPSSVTRIHQAAFKTRYLGICALSSVTVHATTPPTMSNGYEYFSTEGGLVIYVPAESVNAYKTANGWSQYSSRIRAIGS